MAQTVAEGSHEARRPEVCYAVARLERAIYAAISRQVAPHGLTTLQYTVLSLLQHHGGSLSNSQLARRAYMRPQSMAEVLDALEAKELIRRGPHATHRRLLPASVTPNGRKILAACDQAVVAIEDKMLAAFSSAERKAFVDTARAALRAVRERFLQEGDDVGPARADCKASPRLPTESSRQTPRAHQRT